MGNLWEDLEAQPYLNDSLQLRIYTSCLLGREPALVLHDGVSTSFKMGISNWFGESESVLYVKGSGRDLATIDAEGFAPLKLNVLQRMATFENLTATKMIDIQRTALLRSKAPEPSVESEKHVRLLFARRCLLMETMSELFNSTIVLCN